MDETLALLKPEIFEKAVNLLYNSSHILIVGTQPRFMRCRIRSLPEHHPTKSEKKLVNFNIEEYNDLKDIGKGCSALILSFPRYPERTQTIAKNTQIQRSFSYRNNRQPCIPYSSIMRSTFHSPHEVYYSC